MVLDDYFSFKSLWFLVVGRHVNVEITSHVSHVYLMICYFFVLVALFSSGIISVDILQFFPVFSSPFLLSSVFVVIIGGHHHWVCPF